MFRTICKKSIHIFNLNNTTIKRNELDKQHLNNNNNTSICMIVKELTNELMFFNKSSDSMHGLFGSMDYSLFHEKILLVYQYMKQLEYMISLIAIQSTTTTIASDHPYIYIIGIYIYLYIYIVNTIYILHNFK